MCGGDCQVMQQQSSTSATMMGGGVGGVMGGVLGSGDGGNIGMGMGMSMGLPPDQLVFSPSHPPMGNPNHFNGFMAGIPAPFHNFSSIIPKEELPMMRKDDELESGGSGSGQVDGLSCGEEHDNDDQNNQQQQDQAQGPGKKKKYHRHTARQIQEMEALFKECPHPDDKQRMRLSHELGLKPRQVKFWFQNRRTQLKAQQDRADNAILKAENESLKSENFRLQSAIRNVVCPNCGGPAMLGEMSFDEQHLRLENARLKEELERLSCIAARYAGSHMPPPPMGPAPPMLLPPSLDLDMGVYSRHFHEHPPHSADMFPDPMRNTGASSSHHQQQQQGFQLGCVEFVMDQDRALVLDLAVAATEQLVRMCRSGEPLWGRSVYGGVGGEVMDVEEQGRMFQPWPMEGKQQQEMKGEVRVEGTRDSGHVMMNSITLVDAFLDVNKWVELFPSIVTNAKTLQVLTAGVASHCNGSLLLMHAEFQALTPLVPTRGSYFFRYCQQNPEEGFWTIVDFPIDGFQENLQPISGVYKRMPSGCIFQDMPNGYSMVTWVEHAEVDNSLVHQIFDPFVRSGMAFSANRWLASLQQQCDRLASLMARNVSDLGVIPSPDARKNIMRLSQRMVRTLCFSISPSAAVQPWSPLSDTSDDTIRITTRKNSNPGQPNGILLSAAATTWLPFSHLQVFELLTDEKRRSQLDVLSFGNSLHEIAHIANGSHQKNCVSLFRINASSNSSQNVELMLQESSTHLTGGSMVVYATIDVDAIQVAMSGEDPSYIPILPTGFIMLPAPKSASAATTPSAEDAAAQGTINTTTMGCLLTIGVQALASAIPSAKLNVSNITAINNHISNAIHQINTALSGCADAAASTSGSEP